MKIAGLIINVFFPGVGTLLCGKIIQGLIQITLDIVSLICLFIPIVGWIALFFIAIPNWIWAIATAAIEVQKESSGSQEAVEKVVVICSGCNGTVPVGSSFCGNCGKALNP